MALLLHFLFLAILGACNCGPTKDAGISRRAASSWPVACFPNGLHVSGGAYSSQTKGNYTAINARYNGYPIYRGGNNNNWSIYRRSAGYAEDQWVLDFNEVDDQWSGTVAHSRDKVVAPWLAHNWKSSSPMVVTANYFDLTTVVVGGRVYDYLNGKHFFRGGYHNGYPTFKMVDVTLYRDDANTWRADTTLDPAGDIDSETCGSVGAIFPVEL